MIWKYDTNGKLFPFPNSNGNAYTDWSFQITWNTILEQMLFEKKVFNVIMDIHLQMTYKCLTDRMSEIELEI